MPLPVGVIVNIDVGRRDFVSAKSLNPLVKETLAVALATFNKTKTLSIAALIEENIILKIIDARTESILKILKR